MFLKYSFSAALSWDGERHPVVIATTRKQTLKIDCLPVESFLVQSARKVNGWYDPVHNQWKSCISGSHGKTFFCRSIAQPFHFFPSRMLLNAAWTMHRQVSSAFFPSISVASGRINFKTQKDGTWKRARVRKTKLWFVMCQTKIRHAKAECKQQTT